MYSRMTFSDWQSSVLPKVSGSWNLHTLLPRGLDFFVLASSLTGLIGHPTQINYAAANAYQDALARYRLSNGERAVSLDLGLLETKGLLSQTPELIDRLLSTNFHHLIRESDILALFEYFCDPNLGLDELPAQVATGFVRPSRQATQPIMKLPVTLDQPFWKQIFIPMNDNSTDSRLSHEDGNNQPDQLSLRAALSAAASATNANNQKSTAEAPGDNYQRGTGRAILSNGVDASCQTQFGPTFAPGRGRLPDRGRLAELGFQRARSGSASF